MGWFSGKQQASLELLAERQRRTEEEMTALAKTVSQIHTALVIRDPGTRLSAEAYEGLRKTVMAGATQRRAHLVQLVELSSALERGAGPDQLMSMVDEWLLQAGLTQVLDPRRPELYEVVDGVGDGLHVLSPAWIDAQNGALIKRGTAERVQLPPRAVPRRAPQPTPAALDPAAAEPTHPPMDTAQSSSERQGLDPGSRPQESNGAPPDSASTNEPTHRDGPGTESGEATELRDSVADAPAEALGSDSAASSETEPASSNKIPPRQGATEANGSERGDGS